MRRQREIVALLGLGLMMSVSGCSDSLSAAAKSAMSFATAKVWVEKVQFTVADDMNSTAPVTIHLLIVYKPEVLADLQKMPADDYFKKADQLNRDNPNMIDTYKWEVVPGQQMEPKDVLPTKMSGEGGIIFARYSTPGDHRVGLSDEREIRILLNKTDFSMEKVR